MGRARQSRIGHRARNQPLTGAHNAAVTVNSSRSRSLWRQHWTGNMWNTNRATRLRSKAELWV